ncbi:putative RNA methyltransferase [Haliovirga abyssi]|uniref:23S rRNA (Guanine(745)-N(1))-methyltransferase n=1 Tax=Haliovirga abyssi TaxID=2996794 RepID=A0AAU9DGD9_9FUSO|nr:methyltransferase domain-containing protein [Haliovirga abyssi]BDU49754.1 23S rRNA (guanine(745)-N(1))-methyltransferase [Haliovirga abyssi]
MQIICPVCKEELKKENNKMSCINGHSFDFAKQGYINLHTKRGEKNPGDNKEMVKNRRAFLEIGLYNNLKEKIKKVLYKYRDLYNFNSLLDCGCGEGYYTSSFELKDVIGIDISKFAILEAAKKYKKLKFIVASGKDIPIKSESVEIVTSIFTKLFPNEYYRILKNNGIVITVHSGINHLKEIKEVVYENVKYDVYNPDRDMLDKFKKIDSINYFYKEKLKTNLEIKELFEMTPYKWKSPKEGIDRLYSLDNLEITIDVNIDIYKKV